MSGKIILLMGPMCSGKSSELKRRLRMHQVAKKTVIAIKKDIDVRNDEDRKGLLSSRDGSHPIEAIVVEKLSDYALVGVRGAVIGIDEAQFYTPKDLLEFCVVARDQGNTVVVSALSGDKRCKMWPSIVELQPICDQIHFLTAICEFCGEEAPFTMQLSGSTELVDVDGKYAPVCFKCWRSPN